MEERQMDRYKQHQKTTYSNHPCNGCDIFHNGINGRYCPKLGHYVEHATVRMCIPRSGEYEKALSILKHIQS